MTFSTLLFTYVFGGLTFLPLLVAAVLIPAWRRLPQVENEKQENGSSDKDGKTKKAEALLAALSDEKEGTASSGTFAVLRRYDYQAALTAFNARSHASTGTGASNADGTGEAANNSESVYQSMYRSVFDRNKNATSTRSVLENEEMTADASNPKMKKRSTPASIFYIVLRHGHLMLYDSTAETEVRHVIGLNNYHISLSAGPHEPGEEDMKDGDIFIKRTAIVLTPIASNGIPPNGGQDQPTAVQKPYYFFSSTCIEKEDFYHALLSTRNPPPIPQPVDADCIIKLQSALHSNSALTPETQALNALISRIFLATHRTDRLETLIRNKIEKKISRVQKPAFIASLAVQSIDLGDAAPILSNPRLKDLHITGDMTIAFDVKYTGGIKVTVSALAKLDLGPRFKTRTADLLLSTALKRLQGHVLIRVKPSPSNRLWFCFENIPEMDIKVEPVVSQRQITYTFILKAIEDRIRAVIGETLVKPNWDDIAFLDTRWQHWRGGIWMPEGESEAPEPSAGETLKARNRKTMSMPALADGSTPDMDSSATSSGSEATPKLATGAAILKEKSNDLKRRSVASLPGQISSDPEHRSPLHSTSKSLRVPSMTSPSASTASTRVDDSPASMEPARSDTMNQGQEQSRWRIRPAPTQQSIKKGAIETMREMKNRTWMDRDATQNKDGTITADPAEMDDTESRRSMDSTTAASEDRSVRSHKRADSEMSASSSTTTRSQRQQEAMEKGKNLLAATAAATTAAKTWGWNALASRTAKGRVDGAPNQQQEPVGRGQPLPPPGMPLPGPQKGWLTSSIGKGGVKRKPLLPARNSVADESKSPPSTEYQANSLTSLEHGEHEGNEETVKTENVATPASEYGPWRENSGHEIGDPDGAWPGVSTAEDHHETDTKPVEGGPIHDEANPAIPAKKVPPPLPARRQPIQGNIDTASHAIVSAENAEILGENSTTDDGGVHQNESGSEEPSRVSQPAPGDTKDDLSAHVDHAVLSDDITNDHGTHGLHEHGFQHSPATEELDHSDMDDLVAIPAPVDDDADEDDLGVEGVQEEVDGKALTDVVRDEGHGLEGATNTTNTARKSDVLGAEGS